MRAGALGAPHHCAQIMRIFNTVQDNDKRIFSALFRRLQNVIHTCIFMCRNMRSDTLMSNSVRQMIQHLFADFLHQDAVFIGQRQNSAD